MRNSVHDDDHLLTAEHQVECCERAHIMANRVQYSRGYFYFYGLLIALNVFLLAWVFVEADYPLSHEVKFWVFVLLDGAVTLCILIEVVLTALVQRRTFLRLWSNRFDLFVLALCFAAIGMHALGTVNTEELELEELDVFVVVVRYVAQFARLALLLKKLRRQRSRKQLDVRMDLEEITAWPEEVGERTPLSMVEAPAAAASADGGGAAAAAAADIAAAQTEPLPPATDSGAGAGGAAPPTLVKPYVLTPQASFSEERTSDV